MLSSVMHDISGYQSPVRFIPQLCQKLCTLTDGKVNDPSSSSQDDVDEMMDAFLGDS